ncbi:MULTISPECIES: YhcH/YjgK/YiaL family protein [Helicobacter]|uniref:YhcH/YjgK/YiaL family protein n=1 Tax=Helicobacter TaxID=209 RepID=UPI00051D136D|nr:YhcH/YjgK/YiaL family protein [Helicobacter sp. MIT 03-1616]TLD87953.1 DUF386 family protein [Helicobacter sp. MIT 03-1616]
MAIIGKLTHLDWFFKAYPALNEAREYMLNALDSTNEIHKRIISLKLENEERKEITYPLSQNVRAIEQTYRLKSAKNAFFETHRAFIDFQLVVEGYEFMRIGDRESFEVQIPYDERKDLIVYNNLFPHFYTESSTLNKNLLKSQSKLPLKTDSHIPYRTNLLLRAGDLAIFFPEDTHAGGLELSKDSNSNTSPTSQYAQVKKSVLKVSVCLLGL